MKYLQQFGIILAVSFIGELLNYAIPLEHYPSEVAGLCSNFSYIYPFGNAGIRICNRLDAEGRKERRG